MGEVVDPHIWDRFDMVAVLTYTGYKDRQPALWAELERVGLKDRVEWFWDFDNPFMTRLANNLRIDRSIPKVDVFRCVMNHYRALKTAAELRKEHVLVLEDDVRFIRDPGVLAAAVSSIPSDYDIAKLEWFPRGPLMSAEPADRQAREAVEWVPSVDFSTYGGAAVAYSLAGAQWKTGFMERCADYTDLHSCLYGNDDYDVPRNMGSLRGYVSRPCVAVQRRFNRYHTLNPRTGYLYVAPWQYVGGSIDGYGDV